MTGAPGPGRCLLVDGSPADVALLSALAGIQAVSAAEMAETLTAAGPPVDLVVVGSLAPSPVSAVQRVHRLAPEAEVAVLTADPQAVGHQASFAPGVPLDLLVAGADEPQLVERLAAMRKATGERRRHAAVLAEVVRRNAAEPRGEAAGVTAVGALLEHAPIAAVLTTGSGHVLGWNRRAEELLAFGAGPAGRPVDEVLPGALSIVTAVAVHAASAAGPVPRTSLQLPAGGRVLDVTAVASQTDEGRPVVLLFASDVTAQREAEHQRDRLAGQVQLLGTVSESLMGRLEVAEPLSRVADALVPALADWVCIQVGAAKEVQGVVLRHRDAALAADVSTAVQAEVVRTWLSDAGRRAAGGEVVLLPTIDPTDLRELGPVPEFDPWVRRLGAASAVAVPIPGRAGVLGSVLLVRDARQPAWDAAELALAVEIGRRAGIALDNARLYAGQRDLATELQRSLLTDPPRLPSADVAVRYVAATREAQVGGDWYDAFRRRSGDLVMVIGDVVGHDSRAAAAMGQLRGILRGIAFRDDDPDAVLTAVDEAADGLELSTIASAVLAVLAPPGGDRGEWRLRWSNAGHPAPVLLDPGGRARLLEPRSGKADLLLGIDASTARTTEEQVLPAGSTLVLYTDGLVERRTETLDDGLHRLLRTVEEHAGEDLEEFCDAVLTGLVPPGTADDDIAIVTVRLRAVDGLG